MSNSMQNMRGFKLNDLLVIIVVIVVLVLLIIPARWRARDQASLTDCKGNLSQLAKAMLIYASEHNDWYPHMVSERGAHSPDEASQALSILYGTEYVTSTKMYQCRSDQAVEALITPSAPMGMTRMGTSYAYDATHQSNDASDVALLADSGDTRRATNHLEGWQVAFVDAHVALTTTKKTGHIISGTTQDDIFTGGDFPSNPMHDSYVRGGHHDSN